MPDRRPQHASSETFMPDKRPIGNLDMLHRRPTCRIGDPSETTMSERHIRDVDMLHRRLTCRTGDPSETLTCCIGD